MKNATIVLGVFIILMSSMIEGCGKSEEEKKKDLVGIYVAKDDPSEYFVLEEDGTYRYYYEKMGIETTAKWRVEDDKLIVFYPEPIGAMPPIKIKGNKLIDDSDDSVYLRVERKSPAFSKPVSISSRKEVTKKEVTLYKEISHDSIPGKYIMEILKKDGTIEKGPDIMIFKRDGRLAVSSSGSESVIPDQKWQFKNGAVHLYQRSRSVLEPGWFEIFSESELGKLRGSTIIFKIKDDEQVDELRYIRQNGRPFSD